MAELETDEYRTLRQITQGMKATMPDPVTKILEEMRRYGETKKRLLKFAEDSSKTSKVTAIMKEAAERAESNDESQDSKERRIAIFGLAFS